MSEPLRIRCSHCHGILEQGSDRVVKGCRCDPDSPTWIYLMNSGQIRGGSHARWEEI